MKRINHPVKKGTRQIETTLIPNLLLLSDPKFVLSYLPAKAVKRKRKIMYNPTKVETNEPLREVLVLKESIIAAPLPSWMSIEILPKSGHKVPIAGISGIRRSELNKYGVTNICYKLKVLILQLKMKSCIKNGPFIVTKFLLGPCL